MYSPAAIETARQLGLKMGKANLEVFAETLLNLIAVGSYQRTMLSGLAVLALAGSVRVFADNVRQEFCRRAAVSIRNPESACSTDHSLQLRIRDLIRSRMRE